MSIFQDDKDGENGVVVPIIGRREILGSPFSNAAPEYLSFHISFSSLLQAACFCSGNFGISEASPQRRRLRSSHIEHIRRFLRLDLALSRACLTFVIKSCWLYVEQKMLKGSASFQSK